MTIINELKQTLESDIVLYEKLNRELQLLPEGSLHIKRHNGRLIFSIYKTGVGGKRKDCYLASGNNETAASYLRARYLKRLLPALAAEIDALRKFIAHYKPEDKIRAWDVIPQDCKEYINCECPDNRTICELWSTAPFENNTFENAAGTSYLTMRKEAVRSRIELITADILADMDLFYRYECRLMLKDGSIYPDFTVMHPGSLELYYVEIFGMMDKPEYAVSAFKKIKRYTENGLHTHLICLFDHNDAPLSTGEIRAVFESVFKSE